MNQILHYAAKKIWCFLIKLYKLPSNLWIRNLSKSILYCNSILICFSFAKFDFAYYLASKYAGKTGRDSGLRFRYHGIGE